MSHEHEEEFHDCFEAPTQSAVSSPKSSFCFKKSLNDDGCSSVRTASFSQSTSSIGAFDEDSPIATVPKSCGYCSTFDAGTFRVRGKNYKRDKKKFEAGPSLFRYFASDIVEVDDYVRTGFCKLPNERIQLALKREKEMHSKGLPSDMPPYVVAVNIIMPGPPCYHMVFYYAVDDMSTIDGTDGTPSSRLARKFFFDEDDEFRNDTFKLIPRIAKGNLFVKKAVGTTPTILGRKIDVKYEFGDRFCEIICDATSSQVANKVCTLVNGYAKSLIVEMAFLLEGHDMTLLPERIFGCIRLTHVDFSKIRFVRTKDTVDGEESRSDESTS